MYSLRALLVIVTVAAVFTVAVIQKGTWTSTGFMTLAASIMAIGLGQAILNVRSRAFWVGFCVASWTYIAVAMLPPYGQNLYSHLITSQRSSKSTNPRPASHHFAPPLSPGTRPATTDGSLWLYTKRTEELARNMLCNSAGFSTSVTG